MIAQHGLIQTQASVSFGWFTVICTACSKKSCHTSPWNYLQLENTWTALRILWDPSCLHLILHWYLWISWWYLWNSSLREILCNGLEAQPDSNGLVCSLCGFPYRVCMTTALARMSFAEFFGISREQNRWQQNSLFCSFFQWIMKCWSFMLFKKNSGKNGIGGFES